MPNRLFRIVLVELILSLIKADNSGEEILKAIQDGLKPISYSEQRDYIKELHISKSDIIHYKIPLDQIKVSVRVKFGNKTFLDGFNFKDIAQNLTVINPRIPFSNPKPNPFPFLIRKLYEMPGPLPKPFSSINETIENTATDFSKSEEPIDPIEVEIKRSGRPRFRVLEGSRVTGGFIIGEYVHLYNVTANVKADCDIKTEYESKVICEDITKPMERVRNLLVKPDNGYKPVDKYCPFEGCYKKKVGRSFECCCKRTVVKNEHSEMSSECWSFIVKYGIKRVEKMLLNEIERNFPSLFQKKDDDF